MKKFLKNSALIFMIFIMISSSLCTFANDEALYDKFGYDDKFVYEDEYIAHALKSSVVLVILNYEASVEYKPVTFNIDTIEKYIKNQYEEHSDEYTMEEVIELVVEDIQNDLVGYLEWGKEKKVDVEATWQGSGVVIDEFGYIATNSHVVSLSKDAKLEACMNHLQEGIIKDLEKVIEDVGEIDVTLTDEQVQSLLEVVVSETADQADIKDESSSLYVCFPSSSGDTDLTKDRVFDAKIVAQGVSINDDEDGTTRDAAILEIQNDGLVALKLSDSYPEVNSKIVSAGFPVAADAAFQSTGSSKSILSVSVNKGEVTRHVPIEGTEYKALEISSIISGGNSGGPSVDKNLMIEGLNTYTSVEDHRYGYMIPAEYVSELAKEFEVGQGKVSITFLTGLQMLQQGYGGAALECFEQVKEYKPETPYIDNLILLSQKEPQQYPAGTTPLKTTKYVIDYTLVAIIAGGAIVLIIVILLIVRSKKKKKIINAEVPERFVVFNSETLHEPDRAPAKKNYFKTMSNLNSSSGNQNNNNNNNTPKM